MKYHKVHMRRSQVENLLKYTIRLHWASAAKGPRFFFMWRFLLASSPRPPHSFLFMYFWRSSFSYVDAMRAKHYSAFMPPGASTRVCYSSSIYAIRGEKMRRMTRGSSKGIRKVIRGFARLCCVGFAAPAPKLHYLHFIST